MANSESSMRRTPLTLDLLRAKAEFEIEGQRNVAMKIGNDDTAAIKSLALIDCTPLPRTGYKGRDTADWLQKHGVTVTTESNTATPTTTGGLAARLAPGEVIILGANLEDTSCAELDAAWNMEAGMVFPVPRRDTNIWLRLTGEHAPAMFAKICGVDLRPQSFPQHAIAQTSVARLNCIVIRDDVGGIPAYHILTDSASAGYFWICLIDAMEEFGGQPAGYAALRDLGG